jgi:hypothetical protein
LLNFEPLIKRHKHYWYLIDHYAVDRHSPYVIGAKLEDTFRIN